MSAEIIQIRDYQNKRDLQVIADAINAAVVGEPGMVGMEPVIMIPFGGQGIDGMDFEHFAAIPGTVCAKVRDYENEFGPIDTACSEMNPDQPA